MEGFELLLNGLAQVFTPENFTYVLIGSIIGTLVGVLPGVGPTAGTAMLIPVTFVLPATPAIIMLAAIYYGAMYGGTITSVLVNVPGEAASVVTCIEGHEMAKKGRAGPALAIAAIGSFIGGTVATVGLCVVAMPLARLALKFGPAEYFAMMVVGLSLLMGLAGKSVLRALAMGLFGLLISLVGLDPILGHTRYVFGQIELLRGIDLVAAIMGLFGVGEVLLNLEEPMGRIIKTRVRDLLPTREDWRRSAMPIVRGTALGFGVGFIPGVGSAVPAFLSYVIERRFTRKEPKEGWSGGAIEGVAGPETANNAYANAALIPLLTLGIPASPAIAVLMGAFMMNGLQPGPLLFQMRPDFVWTVIASLYVGNLIMLVLNLPLIGLWVRFLLIPRQALMAVILGLCIVGVYSLNNSVFDIGIMAVTGVIGYLAKKFDYPLAPTALTLVLAPLLETNLANALQISGGDASILIRSPISLGLLILAFVILVTSARRALPFGTQAVRVDAEA